MSEELQEELLDDVESEEEDNEEEINPELEIQQVMEALQNGEGGSEMAGRMQSLLSRLEHGLSSRNTRQSNRPQIEALASGLGESSDESTQLASLSGLCEVLSLATEDTLPSGTVDMIVPDLARLIENQYNENIVLLAARALTHLMEAMPDAASNATDAGVISPLMARLLSVEYIDIAEVALKALESIAQIQPTDVLREGFMSASLTIMGFLSVDYQRMIASSVAFILSSIPEECEDMVMESITSLSELLKYEDPRILENACLSFHRLTSHFQGQPEQLMRILSPFVQNDLLRIISDPQGTQPNTWIRAVTALDRAVAGSRQVALSLLDNGVVPAVRKIISGETSSATITTTPQRSVGDQLRLSIESSGSGGGVRSPFRAGKGALVRSSHQLREILALMNDLLPGVTPSKMKQCPVLTTRGLSSVNRTTGDEEQHRKSLVERRETLRSLCLDIIPPLVEIFGTTANPQISGHCVGLILKITSLCSTDILIDTLRDIPLSAFLAGCLSSDVNNWVVVTRAICIVSDLMNRLPEIFLDCFEREGVYRGLNTLQTTSKKQAALKAGAKVDPSLKKSEDVFAMLLGVESHPSPGVTEEDMKDIDRARTWARKQSESLMKEQSSQGRKFGKLEKMTVLQEMEAVADRLNNAVDGLDGTAESGMKLQSCFQSLADLLVSPSGVSAHEFLGSGIVPTILKYFNTIRTKYFATDLNLVKTLQSSQSLESIAALDGFAEIFCKKLSISRPELSPATSPMLSATTSTETQTPTYFHVLVWKIVEALEKTERYSIFVHDVDGLLSLSEGLRQLTRGLRLSLSLRNDGKKADDNDKGKSAQKYGLSDLGPNHIGIDALATVAAVEDFLCNKCLKLPPSEEPSRMDRRVKRMTSADVGGLFGSVEDSGAGLVEGRDECYDDEEEDHNSGEDEFSEHLGLPPQREIQVEDVSTEALGLETRRPRSNKHKIGLSLNGKSLPYNVPMLNAIFDALGEKISLENGGLKAIWSTVHKIEYFLLPGVLDEEPAGTDSEMKPISYTRGPSTVTDNVLRTSSGWLQNTDIPTVSSSGISTIPAGSMLVERPFLQKASFFSQLNSILVAKDGIVPGEQEIEELLAALGILHTFGKNNSLIMEADLSPLDFISPKLSAKVVRQLQDPLSVCAGAVPTWVHRLITEQPFLFSYNARYAYSRTMGFGVSRALHHIQASQLNDTDMTGPAGEEVFRVGRIPRQKVRIQRSRLFESAAKVMELFASSRSMLDIEYIDEPGTGLGPSQEFYTLVSRELQKKSLGMWRDGGDAMPLTDFNLENDDLAGIVRQSLGLFPCVLHQDRLRAASSIGVKEGAALTSLTTEPSENTLSLSNGLTKRSTSAHIVSRDGSYSKNTPGSSSDVLTHFAFAGRFVAKALMDSHLIDIPFSIPFLKLALLNQRLCFEDLEYIDADLWKHLNKLYSIATAKERSADDETCLYDGVAISDLSLVFVCPGCDDVELKPNGSDICVTIDNLSEYLTLAVETMLDTGIRRQIRAFRRGFSSVASLTYLHGFRPAELETLLRGDEEPWNDPTVLSECIKCDHGYSAVSPVVQWLLELMSEFSAHERRLFLSFVTGSPRLPAGGLRGLKPSLTVVRKNVDPGSVDDCLPSVMTCVYYLKLPQYSSKDVLRSRLLTAVNEGSEFHLS